MRFGRTRKKPDVPPPEWLVVGLGNPGPQYARTRHNVGFEVIDHLAAAHSIALDTRKHQAVFGVGTIAGVSAVLAKPITFMNLSGQAVAAVCRSFKLTPERVLVIADDLDMVTGRVRIRRNGSAGGHNGHRSIIHLLGSSEYPRIKIGIGRRGEAVDHVLSRFKPDERSEIDQAIQKSAHAVEVILTVGLDAAMAEVHPDKPPGRPNKSEESEDEEGS